jgi:hypothetical protein
MWVQFSGEGATVCFQLKGGERDEDSVTITNSMAPEPEGSSPYSQEPATGPYPAPTGSNLHSPSNLPKIHSDPILFQRACLIQAPDIPRAKSHVPFPVLGSCQRIRPFPRPLYILRKKKVLRWGVVSPLSNPQAGEPSPVGCPRLLIQFIRSYPPYLEAVSSVRHLRTRQAVVTRDPLNVDSVTIQFTNHELIPARNTSLGSNKRFRQRK